MHSAFSLLLIDRMVLYLLAEKVLQVKHILDCFVLVQEINLNLEF